MSFTEARLSCHIVGEHFGEIAQVQGLRVGIVELLIDLFLIRK
jgi:hypothetical protein